MDDDRMYDEEKRCRIIAAALRWTIDTAIAPDTYEEYVLELFARGKITIDKAVGLINDYESKYLTGP